MVNAYDVPAGILIQALAEHMKKMSGIEVPSWAEFVKTGAHAERPPQEADWWYFRTASLLRKVYFHGPVGLSELKPVYGGGKSISYNPRHHKDAGSTVIRKVMKQLEQAELVTKTPKGRVVTPKGASLLDKLSREVFEKLSKENVALARYG